MNKAILMSDRPEWVAKILNGEKTVEIRKTMPKCELPIEVYIYCTKNKLYYSVGALVFNKDDCFKRSVDGTYKYGDSIELMGYSPDYPYDKNNFLNGKVVAKFTLRKVEKFLEGGTAIPLYTDCEIMRKACVSLDELDEYGNKSRCNGDPTLYAYHISDLVIFDKPKELSDFRYKKVTMKWDENYHRRIVKKEIVPVKRPPQSWQYVEV